MWPKGPTTTKTAPLTAKHGAHAWPTENLQHPSWARVLLLALPHNTNNNNNIQAVKNLLNWTHPPKTLMVYALVALVWIILLVVPGRYIVLTLGLLEFSKAWLGAKEPGADELMPDNADSARPPPPLATKLKNLLMRWAMANVSSFLDRKYSRVLGWTNHLKM